LRLVSYLNDQDLMPQLQSAYRRFHSTETAILKVLSDIYCAIDSQHAVLLGLLHLSAAFDYVDHDILLHRLHVRFGVCGTVLDWIASFLSGRSRRVLCSGRLSAEWQLLFEILQGSFLGPVLTVVKLPCVCNDTRCGVHYALQLVSHHLRCASQQTTAIVYTTSDKRVDWSRHRLIVE